MMNKKQYASKPRPVRKYSPCMIKDHKLAAMNPCTTGQSPGLGGSGTYGAKSDGNSKPKNSFVPTRAYPGPPDERRYLHVYI